MSYRALARSAPPAFFVLGVFARLPYAMTPLGSLLLFQHTTGAAFAGLAAGAQSVAIAAAGFAAGGLTTRFGVRRLGTTLAALNAAAALVLIAVSLSGSRAGMLTAAVLVGLTQPHVGLLVRVHWSQALGRGTPLLRTAFAYESAVDELSFVLGPAAAGVCALVWPGAGPLAGMALLLLGSALPFATGYQNAPPAHHTAGRFPLRRMALLVASMAALGAVFGSIQVAVTATSSDGFGYALLGVGSALSGIAYGWLPRSFGVRARHLVFSATLVVGMAALPLSPVGVLVAGFAIAPYMITLYALTDVLAPPDRLPVAMAALGAGGPVGTAVGQVVAGALVDGPGVAAAWLAPLGWAGAALLMAAGVRRPWRAGGSGSAGPQ